LEIIENCIILSIGKRLLLVFGEGWLFLPLFFFLEEFMARSPLEEYAISRKIVKLMREGYGQQQATAIAFRMFRDGELNLPKTQKQIKDEREKRRKKWYLDRTRRSRR